MKQENSGIRAWFGMMPNSLKAILATYVIVGSIAAGSFVNHAYHIRRELDKDQARMELEKSQYNPRCICGSYETIDKKINEKN